MKNSLVTVAAPQFLRQYDVAQNHPCATINAHVQRLVRIRRYLIIATRTRKAVLNALTSPIKSVLAERRQSSLSPVGGIQCRVALYVASGSLAVLIPAARHVIPKENVRSPASRPAGRQRPAATHAVILAMLPSPVTKISHVRRRWFSPAIAAVLSKRRNAAQQRPLQALRKR